MIDLGSFPALSTQPSIIQNTGLQRTLETVQFKSFWPAPCLATLTLWLVSLAMILIFVLCFIPIFLFPIFFGLYLLSFQDSCHHILPHVSEMLSHGKSLVSLGSVSHGIISLYILKNIKIKLFKLRILYYRQKKKRLSFRIGQESRNSVCHHVSGTESRTYTMRIYCLHEVPSALCRRPQRKGKEKS